MPLTICLICEKVQDGGWNPNRCTCEGVRCNLCKQIYLGLSGDCLCTDVTPDEYRLIGKLKLDTIRDYYQPPFSLKRTLIKTTLIGTGIGFILAVLTEFVKGFNPLGTGFIIGAGVIGGILAGLLAWVTQPPQEKR